jgi:hypothetical protein
MRLTLFFSIPQKYVLRPIILINKTCKFSILQVTTAGKFNTGHDLNSPIGNQMTGRSNSVRKIIRYRLDYRGSILNTGWISHLAATSERLCFCFPYSESTIQRR